MATDGSGGGARGIVGGNGGQKELAARLGYTSSSQGAQLEHNRGKKEEK